MTLWYFFSHKWLLFSFGFHSFLCTSTPRPSFCSVFLFSAIVETSTRRSQHFYSLWPALPSTESRRGKRIKRQPDPLPARREVPIVSVSLLTALCLTHSLVLTSGWNATRSPGSLLSGFTDFYYWFILNSNLAKPVMFCPLPQRWGELSICYPPQSFTYWQAVVSPVSVICAELFTSSSPS